MSRRASWTSGRELNTGKSLRYELQHLTSPNVGVHAEDLFDVVSPNHPGADSSSNTAKKPRPPALNLNKKDPSVLSWLGALHLENYHDSFAQNDISFDMLTDLEKTDLQILIPKIGDRIRIWSAIRRLSCPPSSTSMTGSLLGSSPPEVSTTRVPTPGVSSPSVPTSGVPTPDGVSPSFPLSSASTSSAAPVSGGSPPVSSSSVRTRDPRFCNVTFHTWEKKALHIDLLPTTQLLPYIRHAAKVPEDMPLTVNDSFDIYSDDASLRRAIFEKGGREFWFEPLPKQRKRPSDAASAPLPPPPTSGQLTERPTSHEVTERLADFFPNSNQNRLAAGIRNSYLINNRFSSLNGDWRASIRFSKRLSTASTLDGLEISRAGASSTLREPSKSIIGVSAAPHQPNTSIDNTPNDDLDDASTVASGLLVDSEFLDKLYQEEMTPTEWIRGKLIGHGSFGSVYLGFNVFTGDILAVKQVQLNQKDERQKKMVDALRREVLLLRELDHENIVQYRGFKREGSDLNIFLEYIAGGSLATKLAKNGPFKEDAVRDYIGQCLHGLAYLHDRGIIHRDIKGANILVDADNKVKISDFGLSKHEQTAKQRFSVQGTAFWMAPEVAVAKEGTTTKADIWSLGCVVIELLTGDHPFPQLQAFQAIYKIGRGQVPTIPPNTSKYLEDFIRSCLQAEPKARPSANQLLIHDFITQSE